MARMSGGTRKIGRNKKKCERYRLEDRGEKNKQRGLDKRQRDRERWANDKEYQKRQEDRKER